MGVPSLDSSVTKTGSNSHKARARTRAERTATSYCQALTPTHGPIAEVPQSAAPATEPARLIGLAGDRPEVAQTVAQNLAAAWALNGLRALVVRDYGRSYPTWTRRQLEARVQLAEPEPVSLRDIPGPGVLDQITVTSDRRYHRTPDESARSILERLRPHYHRILLLRCASWAPDLAETYVALPEAEPIPTGEHRWDIEDGKRIRREHLYTPEQAAIVLRERMLRPVHADALPLAGLAVLDQPGTLAGAASRSMTRAVHEYLAATGTPVLARLPYVPPVAARTPLPLPVTDRPASRTARAFVEAAAAIESALPHVRAV